MLENLANVALTVLGISFLIFMHELGHFVAARAFGVRVETFSIGFGRKIFGFQKNGTDYRVALIPLGGYVKMAGEYGDYSDEQELDPDDLTAKPIWQRFIIFSAGVVVNFVLAFVIFPIAFGAGVPFMAPTVGQVVPGGPAWQAGLQSGDRINAVSGRRVYGFTDVSLEVALADPERTVLSVERDGRTFDVALRTVRSAGRYEAGILPPVSGALVVPEGGPAARAGLRTGDVLVSAGGLRPGPLPGGRPVGPGEVLARARVDGGPLALVVERDGEQVDVQVEPEVVPAEDGARLLGAMPLVRRVTALRGDAAEPGFPLSVGDVLTVVDGHPLLDAAELELRAPGVPLAITLLRDDAPLELELDVPSADALLRGDVAFGGDETNGFLQPVAGGALEAAGLRTGDRIVRLDDEALEDYAALLSVLRADRERSGDKVDYRVAYERDGVVTEVDVRTRPRTLHDYGFDLPYTQITHDLGLAGSLLAGWDASINALRQTSLTLTKLFTGSVGMENLGGPLSISYITYRSAEMSFAKLLFFLALLSVNLGFINILPVPVLDGGQIVFLMCEKVKGSRLSERFMANAQLVGLVAILALMVVVTYNDILRFVG